ncbi:hypothetical protein C8Q75DRAFT_131856 [Abortiporus biennis]|nr:hypothetical protein C8Q75DRAFT_131856 [Abortiporus biennis]
MQPYRPRESILSLFDPLAGGQSTPDRNTPSPDASSDKENDGPGPVTVFFNRAYTQPAPCTVKTPIGKLIDFAETPYHGSDDEDWDESLLDEDGEDMMGAEDGTMTGRLIDKLRSSRENEFILSSGLNSPQTPSDRRPLADIRLESSPDGVPVFSKLSSPQSIHTPSPSPTSPQFTANKQTPSEHSLSGIIHSINLSANQPSPSVNGLGGNHQEDAENSMQVEIMVCPPDSVPQSPVVSSYPSPALLNPRTPLVSSPSVTSPSLSAASRRLQVNTSSSDPRRTSVDLYSSFSMQIQSPDMSFDLLNDKISFLGLGHDSFLNGGDDTLDFQKQREIGAIPEEVEKKEQDLVISKVSTHSSPCSDKTDTPSTPASRPTVFSLPPAKKTAISRHSLPVDDADEVKADGEAPPLGTFASIPFPPHLTC